MHFFRPAELEGPRFAVMRFCERCIAIEFRN